jgi:hypothetical protein
MHVKIFKNEHLGKSRHAQVVKFELDLFQSFQHLFMNSNAIKITNLARDAPMILCHTPLIGKF